ncbi:MAG: hypothetical protein CMM58_08565 [Rhodospirillaceae bacterium]|nr:hypothetical protein [Rhodospirillaceae bacterium]|tara:strand:- start:1685 stop:2305 length:621 start_codon:yes stop_codon:yes gene_type:complete
MKRNLFDLALGRGFKIAKKLLIVGFVGLICALGYSASGVAETLPKLEPVSIAVVDFRGVLAKSDAARYIRTQIDKKRSEFKAKFLEIETKLRKEQQTLSKQRSIVTAEAFEKRARKLKERAQSAQKRAQASNQLLKRSFDEAMDKVQKELLRIVAKVAEETGTGVVLFRSAIVIAVKKLEISEEVLRRLNQKMPSVEVVFKPIKGS